MLAGNASIRMPRNEAANEARISPVLPSACCAEKVGRAAIAIDWAMAACAMIISEKPYVRLATLPSSMWEARFVLTQKLSCTTATPSRRGPIKRKTFRTFGSLSPSDQRSVLGDLKLALSLSDEGICKTTYNAAPITTPHASP